MATAKTSRRRKTRKARKTKVVLAIRASALDILFPELATRQ